MASMAETRILREEFEVQPRLAALELDAKKLLNVRAAAIAAAADATPYHPANAPGTLSYQYGTFALRKEFVGDNWSIDRPDGIEAIKNDKLRVKLVFANVDIACNDRHEPKARSSKGAGAERLCAGNDLFGGLPGYVSVKAVSDDGWTIYYLMVAPDGAVELSCATVSKNKFAHFVERIYLSDGSDLDQTPKLSFEADDAADHFDPQIARK